jgi:16S rRNA (cytosine967-C5)-methyltransferase
LEPIVKKHPAIAREAAVDALVAVCEGDVGSQSALADALSARRVDDMRDRALTTELLFGTLRWRDRVDAHIAAHSRRGIDRLDLETLCVLRVATYQLHWLERVPAHAVIHDAVEQVKARADEPRARFTNAVLRQIADAPTASLEESATSVRGLAVAHGHPKWLVRQMRDAYGSDDLQELCRAFSEPAPSVVRIRATRRDKTIAWLQGGEEPGSPGSEPGAWILPGRIDPRSAAPFEHGWWIAQDEGSQRVVRRLDVAPGHHVLDVCAGTGTKTTQIAELALPTGRVVAVEQRHDHVRALEKLMARWDFPVEAHALDGRDSLPLPEDAFDRILVDAPCSGLGTIRRRPEIKWRRTPQDGLDLRELQYALLINAARHLRPGGRMVYSVCTFSTVECEEVVSAFLQDRPDFEPANDAGLDALGSERTSPRQGMDGFYLAVLVRSESVL